MTISTQEEKIDRLEHRMNELENDVTILKVKYEGIDKRLTNIEGGINRVQWILISAIILSVIGVVLKQGIQL